ncbi:MAG TPA: periplasmic heavy metal sensor [Thermoanaerobaculaceae bacterium]|nr:periplasmic heavy metal sensor [Thermoanaerobaculaceae bacterium]
MTTPRNGWTAVAAVVTFLATLPVLGQENNFTAGRWAQRGDPMQTAIARLTLTPEQRGKVKTISDDETAKIAALRDKVRPAHEALDAAAHATAPDPATVGNAYLTVLAAENAVKLENAKFHDAVAAVLTPEQRTQFDAYLNSAQDNRARWSGQRGRGPRSY